ncbi:MAG: alpha/beta hydrolase [Acidiferrobacterales bacterium]
MPAPKIYDNGLDPFGDKRSKVDGILYATDREPAEIDDKQSFYANERGRVLRLGIGDISFDKGGVDWEEARRVSLLKNRSRDYPLKLTNINEFGVLESSEGYISKYAQNGNRPKSGDAEFANRVNKILARSDKKDIYLYVHGFKVIFDNPLLVGMELWHFLGYDGAFIAYAWPSTPSKWAYLKDLETTEFSARNLRLLIEFLSKNTRARQIHIVGYSAGTRVVIGALAQLALINKGKNKAQIHKKLRIGNVILVGSDADTNVFSGYLEDGLLNVQKSLTIYMSDTDKALGLSNFLFARRRLGQAFNVDETSPAVINLLQRIPDLHLIDVSNAENASAGNGHAYFRNSPWVSSDILMTLKYELPPGERGIYRKDDSPLWQFPEDYLIQLKEDLKELLPGYSEALKK